MLERHDEGLAPLRRLIEQQTHTQAKLREIAARLSQRQDQHAAWLLQQHTLHTEQIDRHEELLRRLAQTLEAIKDMLDRGNGH